MENVYLQPLKRVIDLSQSEIDSFKMNLELPPVGSLVLSQGRSKDMAESMPLPYKV